MARLREGRLRNAGTWVLAAKLGDDVVELLLRAQALALQYLHDCGHLPHVGDGRFFEGHAVALGALVAHGAMDIRFSNALTPLSQAPTPVFRPLIGSKTQFLQP